MTSLIVNDPGTPLDLIEDQLDYNGFAIIRSALSQSDIDKLCGELKDFLLRTPSGEGDFVGRKTRRMGSILRKSITSRMIAMNPLVLDMVGRLLLPNCSRFQINMTQAICIDPGEIAQPLHRDDGLFPHRSKPGELMVNAMWALSDFTEENGATRIVPQSHLWPDQPTTDAPSVPAEMPKGSLMIWRGSLFHGGGANFSDQPRLGLVISYCLGWLRQAENQYLAHPPEVVREFPEALQKMLGYAIHEPNLGSFEGQDPRVIMEMDRPETLAARDYFSPEHGHLLKEYADHARSQMPGATQ